MKTKLFNAIAGVSCRSSSLPLGFAGSFLLLGLAILLTACSATPSASKADLVDMFAGVQGNSSCVIGPQLPHGSVNPSPQTPCGHHDGYSPNEPIRGFGQLHVSGTGWGRYGQILISPQRGFNAAEDGHDSPKSAEAATPYYYSVHLDRYGITAEIAPAQRSAVYRFTYDSPDSATILLDVAHNIPQHIAPEVGGRFLGGEIRYSAEKNALTGFGEYRGGFGNGEPYRVFFFIQPTVKLKNVEVTDNGDRELYVRMDLPENTKEVLLAVGISMKNAENAERFVAAELGAAPLQLDEVKRKAKDTWEKTLSAIEVKGGTTEERKMFYTALYHSFVMPRERTGDNPRWESAAPHIDDHYCVWDTWRTKYPLMVLLNESFVAKTISSFIDRFAHDSACTPTFTSSLEWDMKQGGDDVDNVIADAFVKNVQGFDREKAYALVKWSAENARNKSYLEKGWVSEPADRMSVSYTMEFAYNDFCAAEVARIMGDSETAKKLLERSQKWEKLFNPDLESDGFRGFVAPRRTLRRGDGLEGGQWIDVDPAKKYGSWVEYFYEGSSWVYTLFTPHRFDRLIELCGGKEQMVERLQHGFDNNLIDLSNEPGFLAPFIFSHCGRPDLAAKYVEHIRKNKFSLAGGYPDNEDSGAMGAWYVFTSIGLFPNAGQGFYYALPPAFDEVTLTMENGKKIRIEKRENALLINGKTVNQPFILHSELVKN
jgi:predicted alpha-1,2-mannosidase